MWRALKAVGKRVGVSRSPRYDDVADFPEEYELRSPKTSRRDTLGAPSGIGRRRGPGHEDEPADDDPSPSTRPAGRFGGFGWRRETREAAGARDNDDARVPPGGHARAVFPPSPKRERERDKSMRRRESPKFADGGQEGTHLLHNGRNHQPSAYVDPGGHDGDWRLGNQGYGAVARLYEDEALVSEIGMDLQNPKVADMYERSIRTLRSAAMREFYDTRRRVANILLLGTCALDPVLRVGLSVGPNRGISTLLTPSPWFSAGWAGSYLLCLLYALFQALPAESSRPLLRRIGWLSGMMFATEATVALLRSMLTLSTGTLQHFAYFSPGVIAMHIGGASAISWSMVFVSIFALLPCGLVLQGLVTEQHQWHAEDHLLIAAPLSIFTAWMTLNVAENFAIALLSSGVFQLGLGNLSSGTGPAVGLLFALTFFAMAFVITGEGNPYYTVTIIWGFLARQTSLIQPRPDVYTGIAEQAHKRLTEAREAGPTAGEQMDLLATAQHASLWARMPATRAGCDLQSQEASLVLPFRLEKALLTQRQGFVGMAGTGPWLAEGQVRWAGGPYRSEMDISTRKAAYKTVAGIAMPPLCARTSGPADRLDEDDDVIDEALAYCRNDELVRRWVIDEASEKLLVYLSRFIGACFHELEVATTLADGQAALRKLATQPISIPGEAGFVLEGITERPTNGAEASTLRQYFRQCREEICVRLLEVFYTPNGTQSRYWLDVAAGAKKYFVVFGTYQQLLTNSNQSVGPLHYNDSSSRS